jgi:endonuclease/exonuclease/phosphatase family metal-dependent hydrolase
MLKRICFFIFSVSLFFTVGCSSKSYAVVGNFNIPEPKPKDAVKVMTFNIRVAVPFLDGFNSWGARKDIVLDTISDERADVFGLQEALDSQVDYIQNALPQYANYSAGRDDGKEDGEACPIFFRKDKYLLADKGTFWLSTKPDKPGSKRWFNFFPRICSWVRLIDRETKKGFYVYNTHLSLSGGARKKSTRLIAKKVLNRDHDEPFIVMDDFNMKKDSSAMDILCQNSVSPMVNAWILTKPGQESYGTCHSFSGRINGRKIDHIFADPQTTILSVDINHNNFNGRYPSDHFPVTAILKLPVAQTSTSVAAEKKPKPKIVY